MTDTYRVDRPLYRDVARRNRWRRALTLFYFAVAVTVAFMAYAFVLILIGFAIFAPRSATSPAHAAQTRQTILLSAAIVGFAGSVTTIFIDARSFRRYIKKLRNNPAHDDTHLDRAEGIRTEISLALGIAPPELVITNNEFPGVGSLGHNLDRATLIVTTAALRLLSHHELEAAIASELCRLARLDTGTDEAIAISAKAIFSIAEPGYNGGGMFLVLFPMVIATRVADRLVNRSRRSESDVAALQFTSNPQAMVSALEKFASAIAPMQLDTGYWDQFIWFVPPPQEAVRDTFINRTIGRPVTVAERVAEVRTAGWLPSEDV